MPAEDADREAMIQSIAKQDRTFVCARSKALATLIACLSEEFDAVTQAQQHGVAVWSMQRDLECACRATDAAFAAFRSRSLE